MTPDERWAELIAKIEQRRISGAVVPPAPVTKRGLRQRLRDLLRVLGVEV